MFKNIAYRLAVWHVNYMRRHVEYKAARLADERAYFERQVRVAKMDFSIREMDLVHRMSQINIREIELGLSEPRASHA